MEDKTETVCLQTFWSLFLTEKVCIAQEKFYSEPQLFSGDWGVGASLPPAPPVSVSATPKRAARARFENPCSVCLLQLTARETEIWRTQGIDRGECPGPAWEPAFLSEMLGQNWEKETRSRLKELGALWRQVISMQMRCKSMQNSMFYANLQSQERRHFW